MKRLARCFVLPAFWLAQHAYAGGVVHIADGDCAGLAAAASATRGQEPSLIELARNGKYIGCTIAVDGTIAIDGQGAALSGGGVGGGSNIQPPPVIDVGAGADLTVRNLNIGAISSSGSADATVTPKFCCLLTQMTISNAGRLTLDSVTLSHNGSNGGVNVYGGQTFVNTGEMVLRNVTMVDNTSGFGSVLQNSGTLEISQSTLYSSPGNYAPAIVDGAVTIGNSLLVNYGGTSGGTTGTACASGGGNFVSLGGNVVGDASCGLTGPSDKIANPQFGDFARHGGVVSNLAIGYYSPAIGNGIAANCEATDARGHARNASACDSGAYEFGGGEGKLDQTGMSGLYFNSANDGHYVSVQRLAGNNALVIWNTFDQNGTPAWLYGVGSVNGDSIHVDQVAQNVGGKLQPGGNVVGSKATFWGTLDVNFNDCAGGSLSYSSALPTFGSGSTPLERLAILSDVECER